MRHAVILAWESSRGLDPLLKDGSSIPLTALGDRRTFLRRAVDRLVECVSPENLWIIVRPGERRRAEVDIEQPIHILSYPWGPGPVHVLQRIAANLARSGAGREVILLESAAHVALNETEYGATLAAGLDDVSAGGVGIGFEAESPDEATPAGLQIWRGDALRERLQSLKPGGDAPPIQMLARLQGDLHLAPMPREVGWVHVADWEGIRRLLEHVEKPWGYERVWALNEHYAGKILFIRAGEMLSLQYHEEKDETIRILAGELRLHVGVTAEDLRTVALTPGDAYAIPPRLVHRMEAVTDCTMVEVSTPHLRDVVRLEDRYGRT